MSAPDLKCIYHYTDKSGYNGIRAQEKWIFKAGRQHHYPNNPDGAYFTKLPPNAPNLGRRLRIGREKREYVFEFEDGHDLELLNIARTLDCNYILYSKFDYIVDIPRQMFCGEAVKWKSAA